MFPTQAASCKLSNSIHIGFTDFLRVFPHFDAWKSGIKGVRSKIIREASLKSSYILALIYHFHAY